MEVSEKPFIIGHFQIYHNTLFVPLKFYVSIVFNISWDLSQIENNAYEKFWRDKKEYHGKFENGLHSYPIIRTAVIGHPHNRAGVTWKINMRCAENHSESRVWLLSHKRPL